MLSKLKQLNGSIDTKTTHPTLKACDDARKKAFNAASRSWERHGILEGGRRTGNARERQGHNNPLSPAFDDHDFVHEVNGQPVKDREGKKVYWDKATALGPDSRSYDIPDPDLKAINSVKP